MGGAGGGGGGGVEPAEPWAAPGTEDPMAFAWSVQAGDATPTSVLLSVRSLEPTLTLTVARGTAAGWEEISSGDSFTADDGVVQLELSDLEPDNVYSYAFYSADGTRRTRVGRFRTALAPGASRVIRFGSCSCFGSANSPWPCCSFVPADKLDFFLLLGDQIYADNAPDQFDYETKYKTALSTQGMNDLTSGTSHIATWDDHEIDNDWSWLNITQQQFDDALMRFRQAFPQRQGPGGTGIWRKLSWGAAMDVFVLDCRGERRDGNYISPEQMAWLKQELSASTATFKVIANSVPIVDFTGTIIGGILAGDRWQGFPAQRSEIVQHIRNNGMSGILWVAGDFHVGGIGLIDGAGGPGDNQWEVLTGPAGSSINPGAGLLNENERFPNIVRDWSYTTFEADPVAGTVLVRFVGNTGETIAENTLQLT